MIRLKKVKIHQYKSIENTLELDLKNNITALMGMNEAGKTNILEAMAKSDYFDKTDRQFHYELQPDYPRTKKVQLDRQGGTPLAVTATYQVSEQLLELIQKDVILEAPGNEFTRVTNYAGKHRITESSFEYDLYTFWEQYTLQREPVLAKYKKVLAGIRTKEAFHSYCQTEEKNFSGEEKAALNRVERYFRNLHGWSNPINEYVYRVWLLPNIPQFLYYDECYMLPSRISLDKLQSDAELTPQERTAKAFLMLADVNVERAVEKSNFEDYKTELETAQSRLNDELLKYWSSNPNLRIEFEITRELKNAGQPEVKRGFFSRRKKKAEPEYDTWMEIRIKDVRSMVSLPLENRSKGFNWFFSFWVWFQAIQKYETMPFVLLLDEPGMHLHAAAQRDLMNFLRDLSADYQIIYTTHSPYMLEGLEEEIYCVSYEKDGTKAVRSGKC